MTLIKLCSRAAIAAALVFPSAQSWASSVEIQDLAADEVALVGVTGYTPTDTLSPVAGLVADLPSCFIADGAVPVSCSDSTDIAPGDWNLAGLPVANAEPVSLALLTNTDIAPPAETADYTLPDGISGPLDSRPKPIRVAGVPDNWADHVSGDYATHRGFFSQLGTIKVETALLFGYFSIQSGKKLFHETVPLHFNSEGWFGRDTASIGTDKLLHAFDTYLIAEFLHGQLHRKTNASHGDALTASLIASGLMAFNELSDGIEPDSGYSLEDLAMNTAGALFSYLRNTVPGLKEKVAFKIEIHPDDNIYSGQGKPHYAQERFMFSLQGGGFKVLENTPLRFLDLQVGYYASDFLNEHREAGIRPKRHPFVGVGLNLGNLLFKGTRSTIGRAAWTVLDYFQPPYTSVRYDLAQDRVFTSVRPKKP